MEHLLKERGYRCDKLTFQEATEKKVLSSIEEIAEESRKVTEDYRMVFYFAGHGSPQEIIDAQIYGEALRVNGGTKDIRQTRLTELELISALGKISGKKAIILDACESGVFVDFLKDIPFQRIALGEDIIRNFVALASCPGDYTSVSSTYFLKGKQVGALTFGIYTLLSSAAEPVNLSEAEILCGNGALRRNLGFLNQHFLKEGVPKISFDMQRAFDTDFYL
jgi:hypothetical protein